MSGDAREDYDDELLRRVRVATPCHASWDEMPGGDRVRSCEHCRKKVYNLSAMTAAEAADLVRAAEGKVCVRYYARPDGTMLTQDCPVGVARVRARVARAVAAASGAVFAAGMFTGAFRSRGGEPTAPVVRWLNHLRGVPEPPSPLMGAMAAPTADPVPVLPDPAGLPLIQGKATVEPSPRALMGEMAAPAPTAAEQSPAAPRMGRVLVLPMAED